MKKSLFMSIVFFFISANVALAKQESAQTSRIEALKSQILKIARNETSKIKYQNEFNPATRQKLNPLIEELGTYYKNKGNLKAQIADSVGAWKNVWADLPFTQTIANQTYQVFGENGYYYNISKYDLPNKPIYTSTLRGAYNLTPDTIEIEFTKAVGFLNFPKAGTDLYRIAMLAELGTFDQFVDDQNSSQAVGGKGFAYNIYIDKDIRVWGGSVTNKGVPDSIFIMVPVTTITNGLN